ncbi:TIGR02647 family protein [Modicisalibacter tunisiensis]|uniref:TIGR02647 family protein n=1 Tax=Modicisalibacter tunisiensis TaxID=390637 RepID=UPI00079A2A67|nr:TIGR02647 family protein [Modicisalibacter tunisiensis]KXS38673.1 MAG: hypothetical protein AWU55_1264 [Halomonadaceae bacterium T82-2]MBZ9538672.1 TIGR02647 family protein [Modicisalibacter tunisiensis]
MTYSPDVLDALNLLCLFNLDTRQEGLKVHGSADPAQVAAARRLYDQGLVTQADGGYLTERGREAAEQAQALWRLLVAEPVTTG